ncbi:hypothetical protein [Qingrenia yutianensis]|uniref:Apea-like HEPN domain-containing protein n=1 Tax=Qingrenia yutianensis TaxID=2763676 RepID=A0A926FEA8_9FIRM|nr:hypothetical protein [Qingrenia yutianensis]MBC8596884.1 hypothetical protein [Qingrenia yutianensis]
MIKMNLDHWNIEDKHRIGGILFAQTFIESVFMYSFDSYKAPALNAHYLCYDLLNTIHLTETKVMNKGNLLPLYEELNYTLENDISMKGFFIDKDIFYTFKDKNGDFYSLNCFENITSKKIKDSISFLKTTFESDMNYMNTLYIMLIKNIDSAVYTYEVLSNIVKLSRSIVTELINSGYSKAYLYTVANNHFFDNSNQIDDGISHVQKFFEFINLKAKNYKVMLGINIKSYEFFGKYIKGDFRKPKEQEKKIFNIQKGCLCELDDVEALDPYSAQENAMLILNPIISIHKLAKHSYRYSFSKKARVIDKQTGVQQMMNKRISPMNVNTDANNESALSNLTSVITNYNKIPYSFFKMVELHTCALSNQEKSNQLLNLWTIIELFVETDINDSDKINQICNILSTVMCSDYINRKLIILYNEIKQCCPEVHSQYLDELDVGATAYEKFLALLSLREYNSVFDETIEKLANYPLPKYRMMYFHDEIFVDSLGILQCIESHANRLRWHIMRIYRNRNMVVHDGNYMPYINTIIENLHFYVDTIFDKLIHYYKNGIFSTSDILTHMKNIEYRYQKTLGRGKKKNTSIALTKENYLDMILGHSYYTENICE